MTLPLLFTFDGQARSGKGTIVHAVKRSLQLRNIKTMLIDAGQVFRVLVVSAQRHGVDVDSADAIDEFLADDQMLEETRIFVKQVYHMEHADRDALLYTQEVGVDSAKIGARPKAQEFKDNLLRKWLHDAATEGYRVVLIDGRALEEVGGMLESEGLCRFRAGFYFICEPSVGARRMLGFSDRSYDELSDAEKQEVDSLTGQIIQRNRSDSERAVHPIIPPSGAPIFVLPALDFEPRNTGRDMLIVDTSADMTKDQMVQPIVKVFAKCTDL